MDQFKMQPFTRLDGIAVALRRDNVDTDQVIPARFLKLPRSEGLGETLPPAADSGALAAFLAKRRNADADAFPDLSRTIIKLLGSGEYVVDPPGAEPPGHFGLAVRDYTHSTAPNRRFPDLITQRLVKAARDHGIEHKLLVMNEGRPVVV